MLRQGFDSVRAEHKHTVCVTNAIVTMVCMKIDFTVVHLCESSSGYHRIQKVSIQRACMAEKLVGVVLTYVEYNYMIEMHEIKVCAIDDHTK